MNHQKIWTGAVFMVGGLGMVTLGGCFLLGVTIVVSKYAAVCMGVPLSDAIATSGAEYNLIKILYGCAFASFGTAGLLIFKAIKILNIN